MSPRQSKGGGRCSAALGSRKRRMCRQDYLGTETIAQQMGHPDSFSLSDTQLIHKAPEANPLCTCLSYRFSRNGTRIRCKSSPFLRTCSPWPGPVVWASVDEQSKTQLSPLHQQLSRAERLFQSSGGPYKRNRRSLFRAQRCDGLLGFGTAVAFAPRMLLRLFRRGQGSRHCA